MRLVLIDTFALIHRAYHALPKLTTSTGEPIGAVYGFTTLFLKMLKDLKPDRIAAAFDLPEKTFRHKAYSPYQAHRPPTPDELASQIPKVRELLAAFGVPIFSQPGYEADDVIGTAAEKLREEHDIEAVILTGDLDTLQLVSNRVKVYTMKKGLSETVLYDEDAVRERFGFAPRYLPDFKGLKGDASDNIPGVPGIGEKTASALVSRFGTLEALYAALDEEKPEQDEKGVSPRVRAALLANKEQAFLSRDLATIRRDVPIAAALKDFGFVDRDIPRARALFEEWGFRSMVDRLAELDREPSLPREAPAAAGGEEPPMPLESKESLRALENALRESDDVFFAAPGAPQDIFAAPESLAILPGSGDVFIWSKGSFPLAKVSEALEAAPAASVWDAKRLFHLFRNAGIRMKPPLFDCKIAAWLLRPDAKRYGLRDLAREYAGKELAEGIAEEVRAVRMLSGILAEKLRSESLERVWETIERPLIPVLAKMEADGIRIVPEELSRLSAEFSSTLEGIEEKIYTLAGERFNVASPKQLSRILFEKLGLSTKKIRKTPGGAFSTDSEALEKLKSAHPIAEALVDWRELAKLLTTYVNALPEFVRPETGRVHATFLQTGTATGRLACENPNLQNIPKRGAYSSTIRKAFRPEEGWRFASFDYSQIELRIAAHLGRDEKMIETFRQGGDVHRLTASQVWNVPPGRVSEELRNQAKALNFGIIYGMGWRAFAASAGIPPDEARAFIEEYFREFAGIAKYVADAKESARTRGYAETPSGRKRPLQELFSLDRAARAQAERVAVNMPIQGFAADLIKLAMIAADSAMRDHHWERDARLVLQVHDELLFEIKREKIDEAIPSLRRAIEGVWKLEVPIVAEVAVGDSWGDMEPYQS